MRVDRRTEPGALMAVIVSSDSQRSSATLGTGIPCRLPLRWPSQALTRRLSLEPSREFCWMVAPNLPDSRRRGIQPAAGCSPSIFRWEAQVGAAGGNCRSGAKQTKRMGPNAGCQLLAAGTS